MKVNDNHASVNLARYLKTDNIGCPRTSVRQASGSDSQDRDTVALSPQAKEILRARELAAATPEIRQETVERLREQIRNGTYRVDEQAVAAGIIRESLLNEP